MISLIMDGRAMRSACVAARCAWSPETSSANDRGRFILAARREGRHGRLRQHLGGEEQRHRNLRERTCRSETPAGMNSGSISDAMNRTVTSGNPRTSSTTPTQSAPGWQAFRNVSAKGKQNAAGYTRGNGDDEHHKRQRQSAHSCAFTGLLNENAPANLPEPQP